MYHQTYLLFFIHSMFFQNAPLLFWLFFQEEKREILVKPKAHLWVAPSSSSSGFTLLHFWSFGINCALLNYRKEKHVQKKSIVEIWLKGCWSFEYTCTKGGPTMKWNVVFFTSNIDPFHDSSLDCVGPPPYLDEEEQIGSNTIESLSTQKLKFH